MYEHKALLCIHTHISIRRWLLLHCLYSCFDANFSVKRLASSGRLHSLHFSTPIPAPAIASLLCLALCSSTVAWRCSPSHLSLLRSGSKLDDKRPSSHRPLLPCVSRHLRNRILCQDRMYHAIPRRVDDPDSQFNRQLPSKLTYLSALPVE